jgi:hypothetical protein
MRLLRHCCATTAAARLKASQGMSNSATGVIEQRMTQHIHGSSAAKLLHVCAASGKMMTVGKI